MAIRYVEYADLSEGTFKPHGTMGTHCADIENLGDRKVVRSSLGDVVIIYPGDTLGYNCGEIWRVAPPRTRLQRILREFRLAKKAIVRDTEVSVSSETYNASNTACCVRGDIFRRVVGGTVEDNFDGLKVVRGFRVAVVAEFVGRGPTTGHGQTRVCQVVAAPDATDDEIAETLEGSRKCYNCGRLAMHNCGCGQQFLGT